MWPNFRSVGLMIQGRFYVVDWGVILQSNRYIMSHPSLHGSDMTRTTTVTSSCVVVPPRGALTSLGVLYYCYFCYLPPFFLMHTRFFFLLKQWCLFIFGIIFWLSLMDTSAVCDVRLFTFGIFGWLFVVCLKQILYLTLYRKVITHLSGKGLPFVRRLTFVAFKLYLQ